MTLYNVYVWDPDSRRYFCLPAFVGTLLSCRILQKSLSTPSFTLPSISTKSLILSML